MLTQVSIQRGAFLNGAANALVSGVAPEFESSDSQQDSTFGVDSSEITEHHLQAALSSHQVEATSGTSSDVSKKAYHIPTPKTVEVLNQAQYNQEYPPNVYSDPVTYVRFSDPVESMVHGAPYCMDEDDNGWLVKHNDKVQCELDMALKDVKEADKSLKLQSLASEDAKYCHVSEDQFETVMYVFERATCERHPLLELDMSKLPILSDLLPEFNSNSAASSLALPELPPLASDALVHAASGPLRQMNGKSVKNGKKVDTCAEKWTASNPFKNLPALKPCAQAVYPWWKLRRQAREGKPIVPQLNFDESNENDPYVCFRRREVKSARKTRKTDTLQLEKLVRLESELKQATQLFLMVAQRERVKEQQVGKAHQCWNQAMELMKLKRQWGILGPAKGEEDESLIFGVQPDPTLPVPTAASAQNAQLLKKKRKAEENATPTTLKLRRPKTGEADSSVSKTDNTGGTGSALVDRIRSVQAYIERECTRRQQADAVMEDLTDGAFQPFASPTSLRAFRPIQSDNNDTHFWSNHPFARPGRQSCFRRRVGRGGRVFLDRRPFAVSPAPAHIGAWPRQRQNGFPLATFGYGRHECKRGDTSGRVGFPSASDALRSYAPFVYSARVSPMLLPTPHLSWDPLTKDPRMPLSHNPTARFGLSSETRNNTFDMQNAEIASTASDSTDRSRISEDTGDGQSTQATDVEQDTMQEDKTYDKDNSSDEEESMEEQMERAQKLAERWRYDEDGGRWAGLGLLGLGGMEGDEEAVLDDFDQRFIRYRMSLLDETNLLKLSTDWTHMRQALAAAAAYSSTNVVPAVTDTAKTATSSGTQPVPKATSTTPVVEPSSNHKAA